MALRKKTSKMDSVNTILESQKSITHEYNNLLKKVDVSAKSIEDSLTKMQTSLAQGQSEMEALIVKHQEAEDKHKKTIDDANAQLEEKTKAVAEELEEQTKAVAEECLEKKATTELDCVAMIKNKDASLEQIIETKQKSINSLTIEYDNKIAKLESEHTQRELSFNNTFQEKINSSELEALQQLSEKHSMVILDSKKHKEVLDDLEELKTNMETSIASSVDKVKREMELSAKETLFKATSELQTEIFALRAKNEAQVSIIDRLSADKEDNKLLLKSVTTQFTENFNSLSNGLKGLVTVDQRSEK